MSRSPNSYNPLHTEKHQNHYLEISVFCNQSVVIFWYHTSFFFFSNKYSYTSWHLPYLFGTVPLNYQQQSREMLTLQLLLFVVLVAQSCPTLCDLMDCSPQGSSVHEDSLSKNTRVGCHALLQGSLQPRDWIQVSYIAGEFFTVWATNETQEYWSG